MDVLPIVGQDEDEKVDDNGRKLNQGRERYPCCQPVEVMVVEAVQAVRRHSNQQWVERHEYKARLVSNGGMGEYGFDSH